MAKSQPARVFLTGVATFLVVLGLAPVAASSANISKSYESSGDISSGSLVSQVANKSEFIEPATTENGVRLLGVSVAKNDSLLAVDESDSKVQVATSGNVKALVSTLNGDIKVGDQVAVSPFKGVGMKALPGSRVVGLAQTSFSSTTEGATSQKVTDKDGKEQSVSVGYASVSIAIGINNTNIGGEKLTPLQKLGKSFTGHTVSNTRVIVSFAIAIVALAAVVTLIYSSIYGGIISVGRNPLAKYAVFRTVGAVLGMVVVIGLVAGFAVFLLLR